jgi:hypothetical protein
MKRMTVHIPIMVQDQRTTRAKDIPETEDFHSAEEEFFLDGPANARIAIVDFRPGDGLLEPMLRFQPPTHDTPYGTYAWVSDQGELVHYSRVPADEKTLPGFIQANVFGTALKTIQMFEKADVLGRTVQWAFDGSQLLIVPRAGEWANAYYERESASLQFFYITTAERREYSSLSSDIITHELTHAILDGIAPDLYHATTPQSLALHESIADLVALLMAMDSPKLREALLDHTGGRIDVPSAYAIIAEAFGHAASKTDVGFRSLFNTLGLREDSTQYTYVSSVESHDLSQVLSGALYTILIQLHHKHTQRAFLQRSGVDVVTLNQDLGEGDKTPGMAVKERVEQRANSGYPPPGSSIGDSVKGLIIARDIFKRFILRGLDYLPPGEISFADYGRAIIAADQVAFSYLNEERAWLCAELVARGIVADEQALKVRGPGDFEALSDVDPQLLVESDWAAYEFARQNRTLLNIPVNAPFYIRPRLEVRKKRKIYGKDSPQLSDIHECLFKVSWTEYEPNTTQPTYAPQRQRTVGTTLVLDWETRSINALLTSDLSETSPYWNSTLDQHHHAQRTRLIQNLIDEEVLDLYATLPSLFQSPRKPFTRAEIVGDVMRIRGTARTLHIQGAE